MYRQTFHDPVVASELHQLGNQTDSQAVGQHAYVSLGVVDSLPHSRAKIKFVVDMRKYANVWRVLHYTTGW